MVYFRFNNLFKLISRYCSTNRSIKNNTMFPKITLYGDDVSPPVRFVMMTASMLGVDFNLHPIDLFKAENKSASYTEINPLQKVPALQFGCHVICDSHAIALHLCQISESSSLYPEDPVTRSKVNQIMFFNSGTLFPIDSFIFTQYFRGNWPVEEETVGKWYSALDHLEYHLSNQKWLASNKVSLADLCCGTTVSSLQLLVPPLDRHVKISKWMKRLQKLPCYEINTVGLNRLKSFVDTFNSKSFNT